MTDLSKPDPLVREGWTRQFTASEPRLSEAVAVYEEAGFEVRLEPLPPASGYRTCAEEGGTEGECRICFEGFEDRCRVIYTRPRNTASSTFAPEDGLFD
ncbi:MAG: hypothetical protein K9M82_05485 [Deltaproteobacteria bacterium]|nr:hypothetical protein [Deltaproteobacteria bacterium]